MCVDQSFTLKQIGEIARENKKCRVYVGFMDLENAYYRVNREALWQLLGMHVVDGKLLNGMYANRLSCVRVKGCDSECFRIDSGVE